MKKKSCTQVGFFNLRALVPLTLFFAGAFFAPLAASSRHEHAPDSDVYVSRENTVSVASYIGVRRAMVARYNGPGNGSDQARAIAVDSLGGVYVTGGSVGLGGNPDYTTIKYSAGRQVWVARYHGPGSADGAEAIAIDNAGNVYVTGLSYASPNTSNTDYATIKYSSAGEQQWVARYNGPGNNDDSAYAIAVDSSGNVYVTGYSGAGPTTGFDYATLKYNSLGEQQWIARYSGPGNQTDEAAAIAIDDFGNVYVTGESLNSEANLDYATIKYNSAGQEQWVARYNVPANRHDAARAITLDSSGNVYVTGSSEAEVSGTDYATVKYNSDGQEQWVVRYNGAGNFDDDAYAIAVDGSGNVYVTGRSWGSGGTFDYATIKYQQIPAPPPRPTPPR